MDQIRRLFQELASALARLVKPAARSLRENMGLATLSLVLAFGFWIFVSDAENPDRTGVLPIALQVEAVNPAADVTLANELSTVRARIRVASGVWDNLTAADFNATVDLDGLRVGVYDLPVKITAETGRGGLSVIGSAPSQIEVKLEPLFSKSVPVTVDVEGEPPSGFAVASADSEDSTALVTGPQEKVEQVTKAVAALDISGRSDSIEQAVRLEARDGRGFLVEGVSLDPPVAKVNVVIEQTQFSRALTVSPVVRGAPAPGYNVVGVVVSPPTVTVFGSQDFIQGAAIINTKPVDISDAAEDVVRSVSLDLPSGVSVSGGVSVTVTVRILAAPGQLAFAVPVNATGLDDGLSIVGALPSVQVIVRGPLPELLEISANDIAASVDLKGLGAGAYDLAVKVSAPEGLEVASVSPREIEIKLEAR